MYIRNFTIARAGALGKQQWRGWSLTIEKLILSLSEADHPKASHGY